jgi:hypothetical protein
VHQSFFDVKTLCIFHLDLVYWIEKVELSVAVFRASEEGTYGENMNQKPQLLNNFVIFQTASGKLNIDVFFKVEGKFFCVLLFVFWVV